MNAVRRRRPLWLTAVTTVVGSPDLVADLDRLDDPRLRREPAVIAIIAYRLSQRITTVGGVAGLVARTLASPFVLLSRLATTVEIPPGARIGGGFAINHFGCIFVEEGVVAGRNLSICQGVTIGNRQPGGASPRIGDDVEVGAFAQLLGDITIGDGARIGAMSVVLTDVPAGHSAVGNPARILPPRHER